jgi:hypothetical protein
MSRSSTTGGGKTFLFPFVWGGATGGEGTSGSDKSIPSSPAPGYRGAFRRVVLDDVLITVFIVLENRFIGNKRYFGSATLGCFLNIFFQS